MRFVLAALLLAFPAHAVDLACMDRDALARELADGWGEANVFQGVAADGKSMLEIYARPDGTWTAAVVTAEGLACPVTNGDIWLGFDIPQGEAG